MASLNVLGIDPGFATVGYSFIEISDQIRILDFGVIETSANLPFTERLNHLYDDLTQLIQQHDPDAAVLEELFFSTNAKTALDVAQARGVLMAACMQLSVPVYSLKPNQVKLGFTGDGSADKKQMQEMVKLHFGLQEVPKPDDAADALAIAYVGYHEFLR